MTCQSTDPVHTKVIPWDYTGAEESPPRGCCDVSAPLACLWGCRGNRPALPAVWWCSACNYGKCRILYSVTNDYYWFMYFYTMCLLLFWCTTSTCQKVCHEKSAVLHQQQPRTSCAHCVFGWNHFLLCLIGSRAVSYSNRLFGFVYHLGFCKCTLWCSHKDKNLLKTHFSKWIIVKCDYRIKNSKLKTVISPRY